MRMRGRRVCIQFRLSWKALAGFFLDVHRRFQNSSCRTKIAKINKSSQYDFAMFQHKSGKFEISR